MTTKDLGKVIPEKGVDYYTSEEIAAIKAEISEDLQQQITTNADNITILEDVTGTGTDTFSTSNTYEVGDVVVYDNKLYRCITAITTAGAWDSTKWTEINLRQEQDEQNAKIEELEEHVELVESNYETNTVTIEGSGTIEDSLNGYSDSTIKGKTSQFTTTGKNLFDKDTATYSSSKIIKDDNGEEITSGASQYLTSYVKVNANTAYTIQGKIKSSDTGAAIYYYDDNKNWISKENLANATQLPYTFTTPQNCAYIQFQYIISQYNPNTVMIEVGSIASDYEPYTGEQPAPNPNYPQTIHSVSGNVDVESSNKNLFDKNTVTISYLRNNGETATTPSSVDWRISDFISIEPSTSYTTSGMTLSGSIPSRCYYDENKNFIIGYQHNGSNPFIHTSPSTARYMKESLHGNDLDTVMIEKGSTATVYEEHQGESITFPLSEGQKMYEGDYLADDGVHHVRKEKVFDGTENFQVYETGNTEDYYCYRINIADSRRSPNQVELDREKCNYLIQKSWYSVYSSKVNVQSFSTSVNSTYRYFKVPQSTVEAFKEWLATEYANNTPMILEYELAEEVIEPYTEAQQLAWNKIKKMQTYKNITHIMASSDDLAPDVKIKYLQDPFVDIRSDINSMQAQILELAGGE